MLEIYFVRHGETEWNIRGIFQGRSNSNLTEEGVEQAVKLGDKIRNIDFTKIYASPLGRAMDTARYIMGDVKKEILPIEEFQEIAMGKVEGIEKDKFVEKYPKEYTDFWNFSEDYDPSVYSGESFQELFARIESGLKKIIAENKKGGKILIVTHGVSLKTIFCIINGKGIQGLPNEAIPKNTSLSIAGYSEENGFEMKVFSDTSHL